MSINKLLDVAGRSLFTYQKALNVTSNNIVNANNPNYSKRRITMSQVAPDHRFGLGIGSGVEISDIARVRNELTDKQIIGYNHEYSYNNRYSELLTQVEQLYSEPSDLGVSNLMNEFFNSWEELAVNPSSTALRNNVINSAQKFSSKVNSIYDGYEVIKTDVKKEAEQTVSEMNNHIMNIYNLNREIYKATAVNRNANDLLDERAATLEELSKLANISVTYDDNNVANVSIGGSFAVDRVHAEKYLLAEEDGKLKIKPHEESGAIMVNSGKISALNDIFSKKITEHKALLDNLATTVMDEVNSIHSSGYSLHEPPVTGIDFFSGYEHGKLFINEDILADPRYIAVSADQTDGNGEFASAIGALKDRDTMDGLTFESKYSDFISGMASEIVQHDQQGQSLGLVLDQLSLTKAEYSGVSTDEEMVNVIKFQRSYNASAKLIQVADELFQTIINMV
ncbi:MAG: flagellar hook-associated protein FlgK [Melioribacteraceae bacterium]|nr:flagellar hook-associated protein FlgK [Melioribacteraceae bacterium]